MSIYGAALRELEQYRRDEAAGLLLRLPVPLGATVWRVRDNPACHYGVREAEKFLFGRVVTPRRIVEPTPFTLALLDAWHHAAWEMVTAPSAQQVQARWAQLMQELSTAGLDAMESAMTARFADALERYHAAGYFTSIQP